MVHNPCQNHIQVNVYKTLQEVFTVFNRCSMITVFPESPFSFFPLIEFLSGSTGDQFDGIGYCFAVRIICYKQMNDLM